MGEMFTQGTGGSDGKCKNGSALGAWRFGFRYTPRTRVKPHDERMCQRKGVRVATGRKEGRKDTKNKNPLREHVE